MLTSVNPKWIRNEHHRADTYLKQLQNRKNQLVIQTLNASAHHQLLADDLRKNLSLQPRAADICSTWATAHQTKWAAFLIQGGNAPITPLQWIQRN